MFITSGQKEFIIKKIFSKRQKKTHQKMMHLTTLVLKKKSLFIKSDNEERNGHASNQ